MAGARAGRARLRALAQKAVGPPIGLALPRSGRPAEAVTHFRLAVAAIPSDPGLRNYPGLARLGVGQPEPAPGQFRLAVRLDPSNAPAQANLAAPAGDHGGRRP
jgi:Flp pilus assembly protein TadD